MSPELKTLFEPKSIVLVGASNLAAEETIYSKLFRSLAQNILNYKRGRIQIVDFSGKLEGSEKAVDKVKFGQDVAVVVLPARMLSKALRKLLSRQVRSLVLVEGKLDSDQLAELSSAAKRKKMTLLAPDSIGAINTSNDLMLVPETVRIKKGHVAVISQDCCVMSCILDMSQRVGFSKLVGVGQIGADEADVLGYLSQDNDTKVICLYISRVKDGRRLLKAISEVAAEKPVIILKGGAEQSKMFEAVVRQAGALHVHDVREMLNAAGALARQPPLLGDHIAVVTNFAGLATLFEGYLLEEGLVPTRPSDEVATKIRQKFPRTEISSFIDLGVSARADANKYVIESLLADEKVDGVTSINCVKRTLFEEEDIHGIANAAGESKEKPVVEVVVCQENSGLVEDIMLRTRLPIYNQLHETARVLNILRSRGAQMEELRRK